MSARPARALALIRSLRELRPAHRRRGPVPRQQQPDAIRLEYAKAIVRLVCERAREIFAPVAVEIIEDLRRLRKIQGQQDAPRADAPGSGGAIGLGRASQLGRAAREREQRSQRARAGAAGRDLGYAQRAGERAARLIDRAAERFANAFRPRELEAVARRFGERTSDFQRAQLDRQLRAAIGVPYSAIERPVRDSVDGWTAANVDLIVTVPQRYFERLRLDVQDAYAGGTHPETLAGQLSDDYEISVSDARRIARDQIGKLNGEVNQARQEAIGVTRARWRTMKDNRVRDDHTDLEGVEFEWNDPPNGETPGEAIQCRCYAEPILDDLIDG